jgi:hypothetical protein
MAGSPPHLSPRLIAKSLDDLRTWQLAEDSDPAALHRRALRALLATDVLANLELPLEVRAPASDAADDVVQWDVIVSLLAQAEGTLRGAAYRERIARLHRVLPGHAGQLARRASSAAERLRVLRMRVDFVCDGSGSVQVPREPMHVARSPLLQ